jgi:hypothetical protein
MKNAAAESSLFIITIHQVKSSGGPEVLIENNCRYAFSQSPNRWVLEARSVFPMQVGSLGTVANLNNRPVEFTSYFKIKIRCRP